jgi:hypothetical protein
MKVDQTLTDKIAYLLSKCNAAELDRVARELTVYPRKAKKFAATVTAQIEQSKREVDARVKQGLANIG